MKAWDEATRRILAEVEAIPVPDVDWAGAASAMREFKTLARPAFTTPADPSRPHIDVADAPAYAAAEAARAARSRGIKESAAERQRRADDAVLGAVNRLLNGDEPPAARELVQPILKAQATVTDRKTVAASLRRLARAGRLPDPHAAYWSRPAKPRI